MLQVTFWNVQQLMDVKRELMPALRRNKAKSATRDAYSAFGAGENSKAARTIQVRLRSRVQECVLVVPRGLVLGRQISMLKRDVSQRVSFQYTRLLQ